MDSHTSQQRHKNMAAIKGKDTKPEMIVRRFLWSMGFRYRLNNQRLPGHPDIVLLKYRTCIFVNGCFWHAHGVGEEKGKELSGNTITYGEELMDSECCKIPHTRREFWVKKILRNKERDIEVQQKLAKMGWHCITVWECELKKDKREKTLESLAFTLNKIYLDNRTIKYRIPDEKCCIAAEQEPEYK